MVDSVSQSITTHRRFVPLYHYFLATLLLAILVWQIVQVVRHFSLDAIFDVLIAVALLLTALFARTFPAKNQDRIIRLEERLRMERLLPADLKGRIPDFTTGQLVGLRFASDAELPALAKRVLSENVPGPEAVKKLITTWRADHQRI